MLTSLTKDIDFSTPVSIVAQVYSHLRSAIICGELRPGQALSEQAIAQRYSTSRQPVREALLRGLMENPRELQLIPASFHKSVLATPEEIACEPL